MGSRRTISDLPHFTVMGTARIEAPEEPSALFELSGIFDRLRGVHERKGWLLFGERSALFGDIERIEPDKRRAVFVAAEEPQLDATGRSLPFLDGYWEAYHIWMVTDPGWPWTRTLFQAQDAIAERRQDENRKGWIRLSKKPAEKDTGSSVSVYPSSRDVNSSWVVQNGWDHEHCELCWAHIDPGHYGYVDKNNHWVCEKCYELFVSVHDIAFLRDYWSEAF